MKPHGAFVVVKVAVTNHDRSSEHWQGDRTVLLVKGRTYDEAEESERYGDNSSLLDESGLVHEAIQPDETRTGDVVFDAPLRTAHSVEASGAALGLRDSIEGHTHTDEETSEAEEEEQEGEESRQYAGLLLIP